MLNNLPKSKKEAEKVLKHGTFRLMTAADRAGFEGIEDQYALIASINKIVIIKTSDGIVFLEVDEDGITKEVWLCDLI